MATAEITVLAEGDPRVVDGSIADGEVHVEAASLPAAIGWELKPEGLCRGDVCVPVRDRASIAAGGSSVDLGAVARALGRRVVVDDRTAVVALSVDAETRARTVRAREAVDFTLPDLDGRARSLREWAGKKKLLVCWASW